MRQKVYLAIPNYNMGSELRRLLPTATSRGYDHIYVLDDCSTDNSQHIVTQFGDTVTFSSSPKNMGAGATRNRILDYQQKGIVHFLDADMELMGDKNITAQIKAAFDRHPGAGVMGFRVRNPNGGQYEYNFGPKMRTLRDVTAGGTWRLWQKTKSPRLSETLKRYFEPRWKQHWTHMHPEDADHEHQVGAVVECNMAVRLESFEKVGGFDTKLRFHEIHALVYKLANLGQTVWYVPEVVALKHNEIEVRKHRKREQAHGMLRVEASKLLRRYHKYTKG